MLASDGYAEIGGLVVADRFRRKGVARAMLDTAVVWTKERRQNRIRLYSGAHRTAAYALYRAYGFDDSRAPAFTLTLN
jgi:ribosomal protein S18 acetylase RimI-like enzyme